MRSVNKVSPITDCSTLQEGGLNGFMHSFLAEVMAICRAHVAALGGNALVAYQLTECIIEDNVHKNQVTVCFVLLSIIVLSILANDYVKCVGINWNIFAARLTRSFVDDVKPLLSLRTVMPQ
jgi:hypothetical protein